MAPWVSFTLLTHALNLHLSSTYILPFGPLHSQLRLNPASCCHPSCPSPSTHAGSPFSVTVLPCCALSVLVRSALASHPSPLLDDPSFPFSTAAMGAWPLLLPGRLLNGCDQLTRLQHLSRSTSELLLIAYVLIFSRPGLGFVGQTQFQTFCFFMSMKCPRNPITLASKCHPDCLSESEVDLNFFFSAGVPWFLVHKLSVVILTINSIVWTCDLEFRVHRYWTNFLNLNPNFTNCSGVTLRQVPLRTWEHGASTVE